MADFDTSNYILSENIKVFPCAYRGKINNTTTIFDPEARLNTEFNMTHSGVNLLDSYIISWDAGTSSTKSKLCFKIHGYYFEIYGKTLAELQNKYLCILLKQDQKIGTNYTEILDSFEGSEYNLDQKNSDNNYYFTGLKISSESTEGNYRLQIVDNTGNLRYANYLPNIKSGTGHSDTNKTNSICIGTNTTASAINTFAAGAGTIADKENLTAIGKYNTTSDGDLFVIGNGSSSTAKANILQVNENKVVVNKILYTYPSKTGVAVGFEILKEDGTSESVIADNHGALRTTDVFTVGDGGNNNYFKANASETIIGTNRQVVLTTDGAIGANNAINSYGTLAVLKGTTAMFNVDNDGNVDINGGVTGCKIQCGKEFEVGDPSNRDTKYFTVSNTNINATKPITITTDNNYIMVGTTVGGSNKTNYISAGAGYSKTSGKEGVKVVCCDQTDCVSGLGQDLGNSTGKSVSGYNMCIAGGNNTEDKGSISFVTHKKGSTDYRELGYFDDNAGTVTFGVNGNINSIGHDIIAEGQIGISDYSGKDCSIIFRSGTDENGTLAPIDVIQFHAYKEGTTYNNGCGVKLGGNGTTVICAGDVGYDPSNNIPTSNWNDEHIYLNADGQVIINTNCDQGWNYRRTFSFDNSGTFTAPRKVWAGPWTDSGTCEAEVGVSNNTVGVGNLYLYANNTTKGIYDSTTQTSWLWSNTDNKVHAKVYDIDASNGFKSDDTGVNMTISNSNEMNFATNNSDTWWFGYRKLGTTAVNNYRFGSSDGTGNTLGNIYCGYLYSNGYGVITSNTIDSYIKVYNFNNSSSSSTFGETFTFKFYKNDGETEIKGNSSSKSLSDSFTIEHGKATNIRGDLSWNFTGKINDTFYDPVFIWISYKGWMTTDTYPAALIIASGAGTDGGYDEGRCTHAYFYSMSYRGEKWGALYKFTRQDWDYNTNSQLTIIGL